MHIEINDRTTLNEIQQVFSDFYPNLKIEFYKIPHKKYEPSGTDQLIAHNKKIGDVKKTHVSGVLEMMPASKIADIEKEFLQRFGLSAQILVKEKSGWQQSTGMDDFTLKDLNELGRNSSDEFIISDYEEGFQEEL